MCLSQQQYQKLNREKKVWVVKHSRERERQMWKSNGTVKEREKRCVKRFRERGRKKKEEGMKRESGGR